VRRNLSLISTSHGLDIWSHTQVLENLAVELLARMLSVDHQQRIAQTDSSRPLWAYRTKDT